ncbi:HlyD family secretion protein [Oceanobacter sp. 4_MG-2023]|uniref:HlyD family secretion protein n=1 Tax=Oceanobacter sp. 4_MG-2023 TaxID=3062623 RepID=UPI0027337848|nr:HlyD family secretion protein [Oceanobacter sp. 4_MG-2023]MDP2548953.1 HlyD family secretion protein [Oceanobacter sp. 4_MG-2023]
MRKVVIVLLLLLITGLAGYWWWWHQGREDTDNAYIKADIVPVMSRIDGTVLALEAQDNRAVKQGDVLLTLDPALYLTRLQQQQAMLSAAQARLTHLADRVVAEQSQIASAAASLEGARAEYRRAQQQLKRLQQLKQQQYVSQDAIDAAELTQASAEARLHENEAQLASRKANLVAVKGEAPQLQASVTEARAAVAQAQLMLDYCTIVAPRDGIITSRQIQLGQSVAPGARLMSLVTHPVWVYANFKETQVAEMQVGQAVEIRVDALPDLIFKGHVDSFFAATGSEFALLPPQNATGNFTKVVQRLPVKLVFEDGQDTSMLRPGMSVDAAVFTAAVAE